MMLVDNAFDLEQIVYLKTDHEQRSRMVTRINVGAQGILYMLSCGATDSWHTAIEIAIEKDVLKSIEAR